MVTAGKFLELKDAPALYERMRREKLLKYVVQGDESLETLEAVIQYHRPVIGEYTEAGELALFWWITPVYGQAVCLHGCVFRKWRKHTADIFRDIRGRLAECGVTDIFLPAHKKTA
jgi:hypothetical protein